MSNVHEIKDNEGVELNVWNGRKGSGNVYMDISGGLDAGDVIELTPKDQKVLIKLMKKIRKECKS